MSLLHRIDSTLPLIKQRDTVFRALLNRLAQDENSAVLLKEVIESLPGLHDSTREAMLKNPAGYFFPPQPVPATPRPEQVPASKQPGLDGLKAKLSQRLMSDMDPTLAPEAARQAVYDLVGAVIEQEAVTLSRTERGHLVEQVVADVMGFGAIDAYIRDDAVTEIRVLGPKQIYIVRNGHFEAAPATFVDENAMLRVMDRMVAPAGIRLDETNPMAQTRLNDGSMVTMIIRPLSQQGPSLYLQKFNRRPLQREDLIRFGTITAEALEFLHTVLLTGLNIVITGGMGSGKTALMQVLAERLSQNTQVTSIVTIEQPPKLQLSGNQVLTLQPRPANIEGKDAVTAQQLAEIAVQFNAESVILGGTNGAGMLPLLEAGTPFMVEVTAKAGDVVRRLQTVLVAAEPTLTETAALILLNARPVLVVEIRQVRDGARQVMSIAELQPDGTLMPMFEWEQTGEEKGQIIGQMRPVTHQARRTMDRITDARIHLPLFGPWHIPPASGGENGNTEA